MALPSQSFYDISGKCLINVSSTSGKNEAYIGHMGLIGHHVVVDSNGCVYTAGWHWDDSVSPADSQSGFIRKHTELGHLVWQKDIGGADGNQNFQEGAITEYHAGIALSDDYVYVVGYRVDTTRNCYICKFNKTTGDLEWKKDYNASVNFTVTDCETDSSGNLHIVGQYTDGNGTQYGLFTKFNSSGVIQWQKYISDLITHTGLFVDSEDYFHIMGRVTSGSNQPATLFKYSSGSTSPSLQAKRQYERYTYDQFADMAEDSSGNIYVVGSSTGSLSNNSFPIVMKLNSDTNSILWCKKVGTIGLWNSHKQRINSIAIDLDDNVYAAGRSGPDSNSWKAFIVKFNSSGTVQWQRELGIDNSKSSCDGIKIDSRGNMIIIGDHDNLTTNKTTFFVRLPNDGSATGYHIVGSETWAYHESNVTIADLTGFTITGPGGNNLSNATMTIANSSLDVNSYTATSTTKILDIGAKYFINITGSWGLDNVPYDGNAITLDSNDIIYSCGYYREDDAYPYLPNSGWLGQFDQHGKLEWQRSIGGSNATTWADPSEIIMDSAVSPDDEYVYVVGHNTAGGIIGNGIIFKYNKSGTIQWKKDWGGNTNDQDLNACVTDSSGNLYVAGEHHYTESDTYQGLVMKLNSSGVIQWQKLLGSRTSFRDMTIDSSDNIYVTGSIDSGPADNLVVKFNSSGSITWQRRLTRGSSNYWESSGAIAVDLSGNVYITGFSNHDSSTDDQPFLLKLDSDGIFQWARSMGNYAYNDRSETVTCDSEGYVYWGGIENPGTGSSDNNAVIIKFNSSGSEQWKRKLSVSNKNTYCYSVKTDLRNDFVCSGNCWVDGGYGTTDQWIARFPGDGTKTGTYTLNGDSWVYASSSITVATSNGWSVTNPAKSLSNISYSVSDSSQSDASYTHSTSTVHI